VTRKLKLRGLFKIKKIGDKSLVCVVSTTNYKGWSQDKIQRHRQAFDPHYRQEEEMLYSFSEWLSWAFDSAQGPFKGGNVMSLIS
jgi:hypothetical protein